MELGTPRASQNFPSSPSEEAELSWLFSAAAKVSRHCARLPTKCWGCGGWVAGKGIWGVKFVILPTRILRSAWEDRAWQEEAASSYLG